MNTATAAQLKKVQKVSTFVRGAFQTLMVLVAIAALLRLATLAFMPDSAITMTDTGVDAVAGENRSFDFRLNLLGIELRAEEIGLTLRVFCGIALALSVVVHMKILQHLINLFSGYAQGLIFTRENVKQIRQIGITILFIPVLWIVLALGFNILFAAAEPGTATMESRFPIMAILAGIIVILISWIMDVGRALHEESELVI